jgi:hypothetical protein
MARQGNDDFDLDAALEDVKDKGTSLRWPVPIDHRLDLLVKLGRGERTNRTELLASLVLTAPESAEELSQIIRRYRSAKVRNALVGEGREGEVISIARPRKPGPRPRGGLART